MRNHIFEEHQRYLARYDGHRRSNDDSNQHAKNENPVNEWLDKWGLLI
ncbi:MAG: hypothetical protein ABJB34_00160 [Acidobacteriota bacterium]